MHFTWNEKGYVIEFSRHYRQLSRPTPQKTTYPYTTVDIFEINDKLERVPFRTWTVGAYFKDRFTPEDGRRAALRGALYSVPGGNPLFSLSKDFKRALWDSYFTRWPGGEWRLR